jgi:hypothetical protein
MRGHVETTLTGAVTDLIALMEPYRGQAEVTLPGESWDMLIDGVVALRAMARSVERELGSFRTLEAARFAKGAMEEVATDAAGALVLDPEGKIIRPEFGKRS